MPRYVYFIFASLALLLVAFGWVVCFLAEKHRNGDDEENDDDI